MSKVKVKELKKGDYFTRREVKYPIEEQVFVRGEYDRSERLYLCTRFSDINSWILIKGDTEVFTDFVF